MKGNLNIDSFHKLLQNDGGENALIQVLQKLTEVKDTNKLAAGVPDPTPLGSWSGWSLW